MEPFVATCLGVGRTQKNSLSASFDYFVFFSPYFFFSKFVRLLPEQFLTSSRTFWSSYLLLLNFFFFNVYIFLWNLAIRFEKSWWNVIDNDCSCDNCNKNLLITIIYVLQQYLRCQIILFKLNKKLKCKLHTLKV